MRKKKRITACNGSRTWFGVFDQAFHSVLHFKMQFTVLGVLFTESQKLVEQWIIGWVSEVFREGI